MVGLSALREYRVKNGLSQEELGSRIGVTGETIYRWETGRREPRKQQRQKISEVTGIPPQLLVQTMLESEAVA